MSPKSIVTAEESKQVGWDDEIIDEYPDPIKFAGTLNHPADRIQLLKWHRYLRGPRSKDEREMIRQLLDKLEETYPNPAAAALKGILKSD